MSLGDLQRRLLTAVMTGRPVPELSAAGQRVYANNVRGQLLAALRDTYEKCEAWLGDDVFHVHARAYIEAHGSTSWSLDHYGSDFPDYLARAFPERLELSELAWLEWALRTAFSGRNASGLALEELHVKDWDGVQFSFVPTLMYRQLHTNAPALWAGIATGQGIHTRPSDSATDNGHGVRVWRHELTPRFVSMTRAEHACLDLVVAGATFGEVCEWLSSTAREKDVASAAGSLLRAWATDGLITGVRETG
ncbi:DNA-binding domain-containing protein [Luteibacter sp. 9133]|uniref:HvfC/BufC N-terminal domain-containing protein n=1 Tax=Luteibacter sp. 9133 TaxID=1500891 RepID=UPI00068A54DF|nr:DNA-binding domain-containing protein [Luteibacter sp. 9133]